MLQQIAINDFSSTPKYLQIYNSIVEGIKSKAILPGDKLPSIFEVCAEFDISKRTVERAYDLLKEKKVIDSTRGKGYYIARAEIEQPLRVFLLFNKLSAHKQLIYDAFVAELGPDVPIDFFIYNGDFRLFKTILLNHAHGYTHYVIIAHFYEGGERAVDLINTLPKHKLVVMDKLIDGLTGRYSAVYQDFENDLFNALTEALPPLRKYHTLNILFPANSYHPTAILNGFHRFCSEHGFQARVIADPGTLVVQPGNAYINLREEDLVALIKRIKDTRLQLGREVGILSYNDTLLKELLLDGITVISTDFGQMGRTAAQIVLGHTKLGTNTLSTTPQQVRNPFRLILRQSL
jgi:DNA-binding transcriptional regulator YhcF (GntR family)